MSARSDRAVRLTRSGSVPAFLAFGLVAFAVVLLGVSPTYNPIDVFRGFVVRVPDVIDVPQTRALQALENEHLDGHVRFAHSARIGRGRVMEQHPKAGSSVRRGSAVDLVVSRGPALVTLPDVVGHPSKEAAADLHDLGLDARLVEKNDETVPVGQVISQKPTAGRIVLGGTDVELAVSLGPAIRQVPEVVGIPLEGAAFRIGQSGLALGEITYADDANVPTGAVISVDPAVGQQQPRDTPVRLVVSTGKPAVAVPDVMGRQQKEATDALSGAGFLVGQIIQTGVVKDPADGTIVAQDPPAGTPLRPGQVVTVTVRRAASPPTTTAPPTTAAPSAAPPAAGP